MANENTLPVSIVFDPSKAEAQMRDFTRTAESIFAASEARKAQQTTDSVRKVKQINGEYQDWWKRSLGEQDNFEKMLRQAHVDNLKRDLQFEKMLRQAHLEDIKQMQSKAASPLTSLGLRTLDEDKERLAKIRSAMDLVTKEFVSGNRSADEFVQTMRKLKGLENVQLFGDSRARGEVHRFLAKTASLTFELTGAFYGLVTAMSIVGAGAILGVKFQKDVEVAQMGMTGIITSMGLIDKAAISVADSWGIAGVYIGKVREDSIKYGVDMSKLTEVNRAVMAPLLSAGIKLPEIQKFATAGAVAVSALGLGAQQFVQEVRDLATAGITAANSTLATSLGVTNTMVKEWKKNGTFIEEMLKRLDGFNKTSEEMLRKTLTGSWDILKAKLGAALQDPEAFKGIIRSINSLSDAISSPAFKTGVEFYWGVLKGIASTMMDFIGVIKMLTPALIAFASVWATLRVIEIAKNAMLAATFVYGRAAAVVTSLTGSTIALAEAELVQAAAARTSAAAVTGAATAAIAASTAMTRAAAIGALARGLGWIGLLIWGIYEIADHFGIVDKYFTSIEDRAKKAQEVIKTLGDESLKDKLAAAAREVTAAENVKAAELKMGKADKTSLAKAEKVLADAKTIYEIYWTEWDKRATEEQKFRSMLPKVEGKLGLDGTTGTGADRGHQARMEVLQKEFESKITADNKTLTNAERVAMEYHKLDWAHLKDVEKIAEVSFFYGALQAAQLLDVKEAHEKVLDTLAKEKDAYDKLAKKEPTQLEQIYADNAAREEKIKLLQKELDLREKFKTAPTDIEKSITLGRIDEMGNVLAGIFGEDPRKREPVTTTGGIRAATGASTITTQTLTKEDLLAMRDKSFAQLSDVQIKEQSDAYMAAMASAGLAANELIAKDWQKKLDDISSNFKNIFSDAMKPGVNVMQTLAKSFENAMRQSVTQLMNDALFKNMLKPAVEAFANSMAGAAGGISSLFAPAAGGMGIGGGALMPQIGAAMMAASILQSAFGHGERQYEDRRLVGTATRGGFQGEFQQSWTQAGGWLSSDRKGVETMALTAAETRKVNAEISSLQVTFNNFGDAIGDAGVRTRDWTATINAAGDTSSVLADAIGSSLLPVLEEFRIAGEDLAKTAERLTGIFQTTNYLINALGLSAQEAFGAIGLSGTTMREQLIAAAGGEDAFAQAAQSFVTNFLTPIQQLGPDLDAVARTFNRLHISGISTNEQFAKLVEAEMAIAAQTGDYSIVGQLLAVADSFNKITASAAEANAELKALLKEDMFRTLVEFQRAQAQVSQGTYYAPNVAAAQAQTTGVANLIAGAQAGVAPIQGAEQVAADLLARQTAAQSAIDAALAAANMSKVAYEAYIASLDPADYSYNQNNIDWLLSEWQKKQSEYEALMAIGIPAFAAGGFHSGGLALVGENGPEIINTGPAMITNNRDTKSLLNAESIVEAIQMLIEEQRAANLAIARNTGIIAKLHTRWEGDGIPETRTVTA